MASNVPLKPPENIENIASPPPEIIFGFPCNFHRNIDQLLNKDVVLKCEFKVDKNRKLYHVIHFKTLSSTKVITQLTSCRYVLGYDGNLITLYELIRDFIITPISRLSIDTRFYYLSFLFNDIFNYVYELTERKLINNYLLGNEHNVKFFCDNIAFINAKSHVSYILRCSLISTESSKTKIKFMKQYASILLIAKYILFTTVGKFRQSKDVASKVVEKKANKIEHGGQCKLKNYKCRMTYIEEAPLHSVFCMSNATKHPAAYKLLRLVDIFNVPKEPHNFMIHQVFELY